LYCNIRTFGIFSLVELAIENSRLNYSDDPQDSSKSRNHPIGKSLISSYPVSQAHYPRWLLITIACCCGAVGFLCIRVLAPFFFFEEKRPQIGIPLFLVGFIFLALLVAFAHRAYMPR